MYLIGANVISELRKKSKENKGVRAFFRQTNGIEARMFLSVVTIGVLHRGVELILHRRDVHQAVQLEKWLENLLAEYQEQVLDINHDIAQAWGCIRVPHPEIPWINRLLR